MARRRRNSIWNLSSFTVASWVRARMGWITTNQTPTGGVSADLQWSLVGAPEQFEDNATQSCYWELQKFLTMALKANPNILECLYSPIVEKTTPLGEELLAARQSFLSQMIFQTFNGYAMSQFKKIEQDIRNQPSRDARRSAKAAAPNSA